MQRRALSFLFAALALLVDRRGSPHWRVAFGAGLFLGALQATHIDAALILAGVPVVMLVAWLRATTDAERRRVRTSNDALAARSAALSRSGEDALEGVIP